MPAAERFLDPGELTCSNCRYDLAGLPVGGRCPECGLAVRASMPRGRGPAPPRVAVVRVLWFVLPVFFVLGLVRAGDAERGANALLVYALFHALAGIVGLVLAERYRHAAAWIALYSLGIVALLLLGMGMRVMTMQVT